MLATDHKRGHRLEDLSPFDSAAPAAPGVEAPSSLQSTQRGEADYGCVEWFHYFEPVRTARLPLTARPRRVSLTQ